MTLNSSNPADAIVRVRGVSKTYANGFQALKNVDLDIRRGEILALLGPNGAGKTTLISIICCMSTASSGTITADGHDTVRDYRAARASIGLVPRSCTPIRLKPCGTRSASAGACLASRPTRR